MSEREPELLRSWPRVDTRSLMLSLLIAIFYAWGFSGTDVSATELVRGRDGMTRFADALFAYPYFEIGGVTLREQQIRRAGRPQLNADGSPKLETVFVPAGFAGVLDRVPLLGWLIDVQDTDGDGSADVTVFAGPDFDLTPLYGIPLPAAFPKVVETIQMAVIGTTFGIVGSLVFGALAAKNIAPRRWVYHATRLLLNGNRALPEIIWALIFVSAVGLGPFAGVLALAVASVGSLGKLVAEAFEAVDPQPILAIQATGANQFLTFLYGVIPQAAPLIASYSLLYFESNVRRASILGIVGAGGIGFLLDKYVRLFQYSKLMGALVILIIMVTAIDQLSDRLRSRLV